VYPAKDHVLSREPRCLAGMPYPPCPPAAARLVVIPLPAPGGLFPCAAQAFLIGRAVRDPHDGQLRSAVAALGITSRSLRRGGTPAVIAAAARGHWTLRCCIMSVMSPCAKTPSGSVPGHQPRSWPAVRNTAVAALRLAGFTGVAAGRRWAARNPARPLAALNLMEQQ
jgi:hypothetical protein